RRDGPVREVRSADLDLVARPARRTHEGCVHGVWGDGPGDPGLCRRRPQPRGGGGVRAIGKPIDDANAEAMSRHWQVTSSAEELDSAAETVKDSADWMCAETDLEHLPVIKAAISAAKEVLSAIEKDIDPDISALMGEQQVEVGEFRLERRGG